MGLNSLHNLILRIKTGIGNCTHWQDPGKCYHLDMEMRHSRRYLHNSGQEALEKVSQGYIRQCLHHNRHQKIKHHTRTSRQCIDPDSNNFFLGMDQRRFESE